MAENSSSSPAASSSGGYRPWWMESKETLAKPFWVVRSLSRVAEISGDKPLPKWTDADVAKFAEEDAVYGPRVLKARAVAQAALAGAGVGGLGSAAYCLRATKSPAGAFLVLLVGSAAGWAVTEEAASLAYQTQRGGALEANLKFLEWWRQKQQS